MRMLVSALGAALLLAATARATSPRLGMAFAAGVHPHAATGRAGALADDPDSGADMLDAPAPEWSFTRWIGPPLLLARLRGRVVLLRWWTEGCQYCAATLPELERLRRQRADQGLVVIGVFHPKPPREVSDRQIVALAKRLGYRGPLAVDRDWTTLDRYWLTGHPERAWTSVSFLIDRDGMIRWVHGGGEYHPSADPAHARCAVQYRELEKTIALVLAERPHATSTP